MNMVKMTMNDLSQELTAEELRELEAAEKKEPVFDDDSPAMMREQLMQFKRINHQNTTKPTIRKFNESDYEPLRCLLSDPRVMLYLEPPYSKEQTKAFLQDALSDHPPVYAVELDSRFIGYVIYHAYDQDSVEIGWVLFPECWGKGYASELTKQMADKARYAGKTLVIECDPGQEVTKHIAVKHGFVWSEKRDELEIYRLS